jgi:hypothetical protein
MMRLRTLLEKSSDADLLREMVGFAAQRLMELEVESLTGAAHGERSPAAQEQLFSGLSATAPHGREGPHRGDPGGLGSGSIDALG